MDWVKTSNLLQGAMIERLSHFVGTVDIYRHIYNTFTAHMYKPCPPEEHGASQAGGWTVKRPCALQQCLVCLQWREAGTEHCGEVKSLVSCHF